MPPGAVYVGRPGRWGNPFITGSTVRASGTDADGWAFEGVPLTMTAAMAVEAFRDLMQGRLTMEGTESHEDDRRYVEEWQRGLERLRGRDLVCWCPLDQPCHADVLLELANR